MAPYVQPPRGSAGYVFTAINTELIVPKLASGKGKLDKAVGSTTYSGVTNYSSQICFNDNQNVGSEAATRKTSTFKECVKAHWSRNK